MKILRNIASKQFDPLKQNELCVKRLSEILQDRTKPQSFFEELLDSKKSLSLIHYILTKNTRSSEDIQILNTYLKHKEKLISFIKRDDIDNTNIDELLCKITKNLKSHSSEGNSFLFHIGDKGNKFYIILKGSVSVLLPEERKVKMNISQYKKYLLQLYQ